MIEPRPADKSTGYGYEASLRRLAKEIEGASSKQPA